MTLMISLFPKGCQWPEQPSLPEPVQTGPAKPSLQQAPVFPVHAAGAGHLFPAFLYSLWSLLCHGERGRLLLLRPTGIRCHHSNIFGHCCKLSGKSLNRTKGQKTALLSRKIDITAMFVMHVSVPRLDLTNATGLLSITSSYGAACQCTLPYYLQCKVTAYLASFRVISHS